MPVDRASSKVTARPIPAGWALDAILRCDVEHGSFFRFLHHASHLRRQGVFLALTQIDWDRPELLATSLAATRETADLNLAHPLATIADGLMKIRVRDLVQVIFGRTCQGLVGALAKCGDDPLDEFNYQFLHAMHDDNAHRARASLLRNIAKIDDDVVEVVWQLPPGLLRIEVGQIRKSKHIGRYIAGLNLIQRLHPQVRDDALLASLSQIAAGASFALWATRWIEKAEYLPPALPYAGDEMLRPLVSGGAIKDTALRYRNCLRDKITVVALGRAVFYEYVGGGGAVAEIAALSSGHWFSQGIYGPKNRQPAREAVRCIRATLEAAGVLIAARHSHSLEINVVADVLHVYDDNGGSWLDVEPDLDMAA